MPIKGLTDQYKATLDTTPRGKPIRIGYLGKGKREGFGKNIRLTDEDHFVFRATKSGREGNQIVKAFYDAYGEEADSIDDVRISAQLAGNFDILDHAWLTVSKHTENGSMFIGQSDGENVYRFRDEKTGKVNSYYEGELPFDKVTKKDPKSPYGTITYKGKVYPWQRMLSIDLILPKFNELVYNRGLSGAGVVTLTTHSTYDVPTLIGEYFEILHDLAGLFSNPMSGDYERQIKYIPLRNIPLRLFRRDDKTTTPDWRNSDPGTRLNTEHSLLHWQLSPSFSIEMQKALDTRTQATIAMIANTPLISSGRDALADFNEIAFGEAPQLPEPKQTGIDWDDFGNEDTEAIDGEIVEDEPQPDTRGEMTPQAQAKRDPRKAVAKPESIFRVDDEIMLHGKADEKPGVVTAVNGDKITVLVDGKHYTVKADKLTLVDMVQS